MSLLSWRGRVAGKYRGVYRLNQASLVRLEDKMSSSPSDTGVKRISTRRKCINGRAAHTRGFVSLRRYNVRGDEAAAGAAKPFESMAR